MNFDNRLKKEMSEGIVRAILEDAGYRVIDIGIEKVLRELSCLRSDEYARLSLPDSLRYLPDLTIMSRDQTQVFLVEVKYRSQWSKSLFQEIEQQAALFNEIVLVSVNSNPPNPRDMRGRPSRHLRCCRVRRTGGQLQVELGKRDNEGGGCEWVNANDLTDDNLWWKMRPLQDVFVQVSDRRNERTLMSAIAALSGIILP